ncbi:TolC family protein [Vreelandella rituensis]|uniref:TolC family protein n=1 Tax=Vreelandella rituensis TaxID=2282306 RepID=A0A368U151_9GAMM|nr:TolC family protein [Halomonas rituensis]RCV90758.1 TolC family protein [Halomonas rituensis]
MSKKGTPSPFKWASILFVLLIPEAASALSLEEALAISREQATTLQSLAAETQRAEATHQQTAQAYLPTISADATWLRADSSFITGVPVPTLGIPLTTQRRDFGPVEGTLTGIQVTQPLFNADAIQTRQSAALNVDARRYAEQWGQQAIRLEVSRLYFNFIRQQQREETAQMSLLAAQASARLAQASYREGMASRLDTEQADAELAAAQARVAQAIAEKRQAKLMLKRLLGIAPQQEVALSSALPEPAPPVGIDATQSRKDLQARKLAATAASAAVKASRAEWLPNVNLLARQQWLDGDEPLNTSGDGWLVAVNLQWTLFDGLGREGRIAESQAKERSARVELDETRRRIQQEQAIAMSQWEAGWAGWHAAQKAQEAAQRANQLALRRYEEGLGSMTDLLATQARLDRERLALINTRYQAVLAGMNYYLQHGYDPLLALKDPLR